MKATLRGMQIRGMHAVLPARRHSYVETPELFSASEIEKISDVTGINSRRILDEHLCASDMCAKAAQKLLQDLQWEAESVGVLIFVSQDADYPLPATACVLQHHLGLPQHAACMDIPLGCSGSVYALWVANQMLRSSDQNRALVLCGDTSTRHLVADDRSTLPLFGDAGVAIAIEQDIEAEDAYIILGTDGRGARHICVKAGGRRNPTIPPLPNDIDPEVLYKDARLHLDGPAVFSFTISAVPKLIKQTLEFAGLEKEQLDWVVMHQANKMILEFIGKKSGLDKNKVVIDLQDFGNTSSASIPLAMCNSLAHPLRAKRNKCLLVGFGVGWSWASLLIEIGPNVCTGLSTLDEQTEPLAMTS